MRTSERSAYDFEFPTRYFLDEARFHGGGDRTKHQEERP